MKRRTTCMILFVLLGQLAFAQPDTVWTRHYGGSGEEVCRALVSTSDGGYALLGWSNTYGAGGRDYWLVRTDALGNPQWTQAYGGGSEDNGYGLRQTEDGGFILAGRSNSFGGNYNGWIVRTNANGDTVWTRKRGGGARDDCYAVVETPDGGFVCAGYTSSWGFGSGDFWLFKLAANGDSLWSKTYGGTGQDIGWALTQTPDSGFLLAGQTQSFGENHAASPNYWIVRTDAIGDSLWSRVYGGSGYDVCTSVALLADGGFILGGYTQSFGLGHEDAWLIRLDANGDSLWSRTYGTSNSDYCTAVAEGYDNHVIMAGWTSTSSAGDQYWMLNADSAGNVVWQRTIGGLSPDQCNTLLAFGDSVWVLAGGSWSFSNGNQDFWLVKTHSQYPTIQVTPSPLFFGNVQVGSTHTDSVIISNISDADFNVLGAIVPHGFSAEFPGAHTLFAHQSEYLTLVFAPDGNGVFDSAMCVQSTAVQGDSCAFLVGSGVGDDADDPVSVPHKFDLSIFPNPFNARTVLSYELPHAAHLTLRLYDLSGRTVQTLKDGMTPAGTYRVNLDGESLATGIYFVSLKTTSFQTARKLVLIK